MSEHYFGLDLRHSDQNAFLDQEQQLKIKNELHDPHYQQMKEIKYHQHYLQSAEIKSKKKRKQCETNPNQKVGHWAHYQNKKYHWFLEIYSSHFIKSQKRRTDKIFKSMANFISTREAEQCRSHHQKMQKKYKTYFKILKHLRQSHYKTTDPTPLKAQIISEGYNINCLLSEDTLETGQIYDLKLVNDQNQEQPMLHKSYPESTSEKIEDQEQSHKQQQPQIATEEYNDLNINNLLSEDYSKNLHLQGSDYQWVHGF